MSGYLGTLAIRTNLAPDSKKRKYKPMPKASWSHFGVYTFLSYTVMLLWYGMLFYHLVNSILRRTASSWQPFKKQFRYFVLN